MDQNLASTGNVLGAKRTLKIAQCGVAIALLAVSAQVTIAIGPIPFTLQLLVVVLCGLIFPPGQAAAALAGYVVLGALGFPVFSGFGAGIAKLAGLTGGYIYGFILSTFLGSLVRRLLYKPVSVSSGSFVRRLLSDIVCCLVSVIVCYAVGTAHFMALSSLAGTSVDMVYVLGVCVIPFIIPDIFKSIAAVMVAMTLRKAIGSISLN